MEQLQNDHLIPENKQMGFEHITLKIGRLLDTKKRGKGLVIEK